jgi:hypothetical protein
MAAVTAIQGNFLKKTAKTAKTAKSPADPEAE